ncbi:MAG: hypothetical protein K9L02_03030 [Acholeplasmataceae bacterium]|nr:hypothetical protein [Acholeplasmataceae bacterium]
MKKINQENENTLQDVVVLNGPMLIRVDGDKVILNAYQREWEAPFLPLDQPVAIEEVLVHRKGSKKYHITSDIFDVIDYAFQDKELDSLNAKKLLVALVESSMQFIAKITVEENLPALLQASYFEKEGRLYVTIGLIDDTRIIFCDIRKVKGKKNA